MQNSHWLLCLVRFYLWMSRVKNHITFIGPDIFHLKLVSTSITQWYPGPVRQNKQNLSVRVPLERRPLSKVPPWARTSGVPSRNYLVSTIKNQTKWPIELWTLKRKMETDEDHATMRESFLLVQNILLLTYILLMCGEIWLKNWRK